MLWWLVGGIFGEVGWRNFLKMVIMRNNEMSIVVVINLNEIVFIELLNCF